MPIEYVPDLDVVREQVQEEEHVCPVSSESIFSGTVGVAIVMLALLLLYLIIHPLLLIVRLLLLYLLLLLSSS